MRASFKYLYGPVYSWRMGRSLGIDPLSRPEKVCNFDCSYCQLGRTGNFSIERKEYVSADDLTAEVREFPFRQVDFLTFSGRGEPTLASNLGPLIHALRGVRGEPIAVITNGSLLFREDVRRDLNLADYVSVKLDAVTPQMFTTVNGPSPEQSFSALLQGLFSFRRFFSGKLVLQVMMLDANSDEAPEIARLARELYPDEVHLNTPLRPCGVKPLAPSEMEKIKACFYGLNVTSVYDQPPPVYHPVNEHSTILRHGNYRMSGQGIPECPSRIRPKKFKWLPIVEEDLCNGCQECVFLCEAGGLKIKDGVAVLINPDVCDSDEQCAAGCPVGAIRMEWVPVQGCPSQGKWR